MGTVCTDGDTDDKCFRGACCVCDCDCGCCIGCDRFELTAVSWEYG